MSLPVLSLQNFDLSNPEQARQYQYQLMQFLNGFVNQFNTLQKQVGTANLSPSTSNLGALTGNTTFNAQSSLVVAIQCTFAVALTLTLQNLAIGSIFFMYLNNTAGAARVLTVAATAPDGTAYTSFLGDASGAQKNLLTGWSVAVGPIMFDGVTMVGPSCFGIIL